MDQAERLDAAINILIRVLTIDERRLSGDLGTIPFNPLDLETLSYLHRYPASLAKNVARYVGVRSTTMQSVVDRLHKRGLVERDVAAIKGRAVALSLSKEGLNFWQKIQNQNIKNCRYMLQCIEQSERLSLVNNMTKIAAAYSEKGHLIQEMSSHRN